MYAIYRTAIEATDPTEGGGVLVPDSKRCVGVADDLRGASAFIQTLPLKPVADGYFFHYDAIQVNGDWVSVKDLLTPNQLGGG